MSAIQPADNQEEKKRSLLGTFVDITLGLSIAILAIMIISALLSQHISNSNAYWMTLLTLNTCGLLIRRNEIKFSTLGGQALIGTAFILSAFFGICAYVSNRDQRICMQSDTDPKITIEACTTFIQSGMPSIPDLADALLDRGWAYAKDKQFNQAIQDLDRSLQLKPENHRLFASRGAVLALMHRYDESIDDFKQAMKLLPPDDARRRSMILALRSQAYFGREDLTKGMADLDEALDADHYNSTALEYRASAYFANGNYGNAIADLNRSIAHDATHAGQFELRGMAKLYDGVVIAAVDDLKTAVSLDPRDGYKRLWLWIVMARAGQNDSKESGPSIKENSPDRWPMPLLALYERKATTEEVFSKARTASAADQTDQICEAHFYVGELYLQQGRREDAKDEFKAANASCPTDFLEYAATRAELRTMAD